MKWSKTLPTPNAVVSTEKNWGLSNVLPLLLGLMVVRALESINVTPAFLVFVVGALSMYFQVHREVWENFLLEKCRIQN